MVGGHGDPYLQYKFKYISINIYLYIYGDSPLEHWLIYECKPNPYATNALIDHEREFSDMWPLNLEKRIHLMKLAQPSQSIRICKQDGWLDRNLADAIIPRNTNVLSSHSIFKLKKLDDGGMKRKGRIALYENRDGEQELIRGTYVRLTCQVY